jgi:hypothetical protein
MGWKLHLASHTVLTMTAEAPVAVVPCVLQ